MTSRYEEFEQLTLTERLAASYRAGMGSGRGGGVAGRKLTNSRLTLTIIVILAVALVLGARLFYLQVVVGPQLSQTARSLRNHAETLEARRGDIVDVHGAILATSVERYNVRVNQVEIADYREYDDDDNLVGVGAAAAAKKVAPILEMDEAELGGIFLGGEEKYQWELVKRDISPDTWREISQLGIHGIYPDPYMQRVYPNGYVAGNILGYTGVTADDDTLAGRAGIESTYNELLAGKNGELKVEVGPSGTVFPQSPRKEIPAVDGGKVQLTIDRDLQLATQEALDKSVKRTHAEWGAAVVVQIGTGRILALGDSSAPDPSNLANVDPADWNSRAVQAIVEPGSTGKVITLSAALDKGVVTPTDTFVVPDSITMPNGEEISDNENHATETMTAAGIIAKSYNTGLVQIGDRMDDAYRYDMLRKFGIGEKTGIELPGETAGILSSYDTWDNRTHYTTMFGQAWAASTLQLGQMISIVGNEGVKVPLHIVDGTYDTDGNFQPTVIGASQQIVSAEAARTANKMLQGVTRKDSTGQLASVPGFNVAGKTGTAQVPDENGNLTKRVGTFVGLLPAENPQVAIAVAIYNAAGAGYGGQTAAPVFADIGKFAMRSMGVAPSQEPLVKYPWTQSEMP
ncbi:peptidoglycan D,D-transpeptidase FtsI family protein [Arcanobacterium buesumense]|uniref:Penicillin-binding protein 2 n=1 Tax=Arcanobacterium buesumense TaxID=2722751 RepID=A0A6H2EJ62_9ACTO|nr:penicillin-binding protein 2 [Arcanobacterium buesumense]QJC21605.1 penicillin-binding protein 2 [Arcanobacterium buesumense]